MKKFRLGFLTTMACWAALRLCAQSAEPIPTVIESDGPGKMVSTDKETTITFQDNVRVNGTGIKLTCDFLKVVVVRTGDQTATLGKVDKFRSMLATGNVRIIQVDREAACGRAEVLPEQDKIILSEQPVIVFRAEGARQSGKTITMYRGERRVEIEDPVSTLPPIKDLGYEKGKKADPTVAEPTAAPASPKDGDSPKPNKIDAAPAPGPTPPSVKDADKTKPPSAETPKQP